MSLRHVLHWQPGEEEGQGRYVARLPEVTEDRLLRQHLPAGHPLQRNLLEYDDSDYTTRVRVNAPDGPTAWVHVSELPDNVRHAQFDLLSEEERLILSDMLEDEGRHEEAHLLRTALSPRKNNGVPERRFTPSVRWHEGRIVVNHEGRRAANMVPEWKMEEVLSHILENVGFHPELTNDAKHQIAYVVRRHWEDAHQRAAMEKAGYDMGDMPPLGWLDRDDRKTLTRYLGEYWAQEQARRTGLEWAE